ncbi:MAG: DUF350 domain-containing protein [Desulfobacteraceae bacterium]|jgi:uncharacterized membrane protein YjfL (UPF0719 family)
MNYIISVGQSAAYALMVVLFWYISKLITDRMTKADDDEHIEGRKNLSMALMRTGQYLGIAIGMAAALTGGESGAHSFVKDLTLLAVDGALIVALFQVSRVICDKLIITMACNETEIENNNIAVGLAECGMLVGTGLIMNGAFSGEGDLLQGVVFFLLGQAVFIAAARLFTAIKSYHLIKEIVQGNVSAGIVLAGNFISLGFIMRTSVSGAFTGWTNDLLSFGISAVTGVVFLILFQWIADLLFLPSTKERQQIVDNKNSAAALIIAGIQTGLSIIVGSLV